MSSIFGWASSSFPIASYLNIRKNLLESRERSTVKLFEKKKMSSGPFVVVEFVDEQSVEVMPKSWIVYENEQLFGYWPRKDPVCRVKKSELPDPKWPLYKIRTFGAAVESYSKASNLAKKALVMSNVEDTDKNKETSSDIEDETSSGDHSPPRKKIQLISAQRYNAKQSKVTFTETSSGDHSPLSKNINLPSAPKYSAKQNNGKNASLQSSNASLQEQTAVSSKVFQHARNAAVSAAANIIHSPSASVSQVNLARIASTDRMSCENASIRRPFIGETMVKSLTESKNCGRAGENTAGTHAMKLDIIIENQEEIKAMLRSLVAVSRDDVSGDVFPQKMKNEHELRQLEIKLKDSSFRKKMVIIVNII
ncbi:uncharacterized protein LOC136079924 [Hydra vulgaris]|uniref:Uncharacterized protein LOC136079924 n=1 Tax=Hydra vulgaris TaxID=6087 RepID=A0ABM4BU27_HYDVU